MEVSQPTPHALQVTTMPPGVDVPGLPLLQDVTLEILQIQAVVCDVAVGKAVHKDAVRHLSVPVLRRHHAAVSCRLEVSLRIFQALPGSGDRRLDGLGLFLPGESLRARRQRGCRRSWSSGRGLRGGLRGSCRRDSLSIHLGGKGPRALLQVRRDCEVEVQVIECYAARGCRPREVWIDGSSTTTALFARFHVGGPVVLCVFSAAHAAHGPAPRLIICSPVRRAVALPLRVGRRRASR
mmetsp:Transcript_1782/g.4330  ORF Transcript_1782/g.4330 Transcript_1782/m.4330 type:complete len:238 (+) Transcript_1782:228-941(+)